MVSFFQAVVATALAISTVTAKSANIKVGEYFRPSSDVSGIPGAKTAYRRSPCPALNSLANHGYLPRTGQGLTRDGVRKAVQSIYGLDQLLAQTLTASLPKTFDMDFLGEHNKIEHDASLFHDDAKFDVNRNLLNDPSLVNATKVQQFLARAQNGKIGVKQVAEARRDAAAFSKATNPEYSLNSQQEIVSYGEASLILLSLGDKKTETISVEDAESFFLNEKIPDGYKNEPNSIGAVKVFGISARLRFLN
jgi:hypothetical protein